MTKFISFTISLILTIVPSIFAQDAITVTSPNGGEIFEIGASYDITWTDNIAEDVKIELFKAGAFDSNIVDPTPSDGTYNWTVPSVTEGSDYTITEL
ncbi:MAG: Ser-Thr-rich GPI-anchored membrane family protein [Ignavibacteriaceae bacterium]